MRPGSRKSWSKPEIIVLVRGSPEESVLAACKVFVVGGGNANKNNECSFIQYSSCDQGCNASGNS
jgi:hypothetical protein